LEPMHQSILISHFSSIVYGESKTDTPNPRRLSLSQGLSRAEDRMTIV
jgi:hypothetical protein